jgi:uncharacterized membrane protein
MIFVDRVKRLNWRLVGLALSAIAVLNISATLMAPAVATAPAVARLSAILPLNKMQIMPAVSAKSQPLPFMGPDATYAMCRYDNTHGTVSINAALIEPGWTLALYSPEGENFYTAVAQPGRVMYVSLLLVPSGDRFPGLSTEPRSQGATESASLTLVSPSGLAILRAPDMGQSYRARNHAGLAAAQCAVKNE